MENASKALMMAGTILISLIVISALIFMFREIRGTKTQGASNQKTQEIINFNKSYESYNKTLYGSELLSLANKMSDYNKGLVNKYGDDKDCYEDMNLEVKFKNKENKEFNYFVELIKENDELMKTYKSSNNLETLYEIYIEKGEQTWNCFNRPKEYQKWYYTEIYNSIMNNFNENNLTKRYKNILDKLFK